MKTISIRDIIGPIMVGPSSSHTAGALRIAYLCRKLLAAEPVNVRFRLYGSFSHTHSGHGTDRALVAGMLGMEADDLRIRDSFDYARQAGLAFSFEPVPDVPTPHPNTVDIHVYDASGAETDVRGESIGGGVAQITRINGVDVQLTGEYHSIVVRQRDAKGVLAHIASVINACDINIATTRLFRERKGQVAYTIMQTDDEIPQGVSDALLLHPDIFDVRIVKSDRVGTSAPAHGSDEGEGFGFDLTVEQAADLFEHLDFPSAQALLAYCAREHVPLSSAICRRERCLLATEGIAVDDTRNYLFEALDVMRASATEPIGHPRPSIGGLLGGESQSLDALGGNGPLAPLTAKAVTYAMAVLETNASMGRIVAAPTAGASGVLPGVLLACQDVHGFTNDELERALANAAAIGYLIARNANVSGAEGGCQAEVGSASAMAASAVTELFGGSPQQCLNAAGNALMGLMGLVCDPVGGLVEVPCQKRNATGAANALVSAQIALAGIPTFGMFDETLEAMRRVGASLPFELRESALGGIAATPSARRYCPGCGR